MRIMKRILALLLSLTMLMSLLIVPANAAGEDVVLKITPDKTSINTATAQDVTYTVSVEVKDSSVKIGGMQFTLDAPSGVTVPKTYYEGFWTNEEQLLAPGENRHFEPGENSQFQPGGNRQSVLGGCSQPRFGCGF